MNDSYNQSLISLIFMRYRVPIRDSLYMVDTWLEIHPEKSEETLIDLLNSGKVIIKNQQLFDIPQLSLEKAAILAQEIQQRQLLEVKDRWYHLKLYRQCFIALLVQN